MAQQGTDPDLGYSEEGQLEDYLPRPAWDDDLTSFQGLFDSIHPPCPEQGSEPLQNHFAWQAPTQPQISTHSAPQLYSTRPTSTTHIRTYHSGPIALSGHLTGLDTSDIFSTSNGRSALPMDMSLRQSTPGVNRLPALSVFKHMLTYKTGNGTDVRC
jgi:hypothetical protein